MIVIISENVIDVKQICTISKIFTYKLNPIQSYLSIRLKNGQTMELWFESEAIAIKKRDQLIKALVSMSGEPLKDLDQL